MIEDIEEKDCILITGGTGLVGTALRKALTDRGFSNVVSIGSKDCDLRDGESVNRLFASVRPDYLFHLAARVYGIGGNSKYKSDILFDNVMINTNVIEYARRAEVKKIVAMGSGCVYPEFKGQQELFEDQIWLGPPHRSEDSYAHSKRMMLAQLQAMQEQYGISWAFAVSGNLYGPHDNFNVEDGHVIPSLVAKFYEAEKCGQAVKVWGSGVAVRDFMYSADAACALLCIMKKMEGPVNMGSGFRHPISDIVAALQDICENRVEVLWDIRKPDGQLERFYNLDRLKDTGFSPSVSLAAGMKTTYDWYSQHWPNIRK